MMGDIENSGQDSPISHVVFLHTNTKGSKIEQNEQ